MIVMIDNYDSFTYNLVQGFASLSADMRVFRNDEVSLDEVKGQKPAALVISPGPCTPLEAGVSVALIKEFSGSIPILGVCLGHQCIGAAFGGRVERAQRIMHGKTSQIRHCGEGIYAGVKNPFPAGRYHSLAVLHEGLPQELVVQATSEEGEIMGLRHKVHPTYGVQFHPESILTPAGKRLMRNFLGIVDSSHSSSTPDT